MGKVRRSGIRVVPSRDRRVNVNKSRSQILTFHLLGSKSIRNSFLRGSGLNSGKNVTKDCPITSGAFLFMKLLVFFCVSLYTWVRVFIVTVTLNK